MIELCWLFDDAVLLTSVIVCLCCFLNFSVASQSEITRRLEKSAISDPDDSKGENRCLLSRSEIPQGEHPLSLGQSSIWNKFFQVLF